jgi:pyruvate formate lyase activating enzyme
MDSPHDAALGVPGRFQHVLPDGRIQCDVCPRACRLHDGQRAFCFVRERRGDTIWLSSYGLASGFCVDPIEKKPLFHFHPGTSVLSFGTAGCNLGCKFCQNWDISKAREIERLSDSASPEHIARAAKEAGCASVAFTYNDPVIFAEFAIDTALACREAGIRTVAVTAGYVTEAARGAFFEPMDAANVDLKAFTDGFYEKLCFAKLAPVLDTLIYLKRETNVWFEVTTLLIPGLNDSVEEVDRLSEWFARQLGPDVPLHFSAFHPDFRLRDRPATPPETCFRARDQALAHGLRFVYAGNVHGTREQSTYCAGCGALLVERDWYNLGRYELDGDACKACGASVPGRFPNAPPGRWGRRRLRVSLNA